ncbi:hypothetical protein NHF50_11175 [Flavobacterium sp. NRK F10]|uniref:DUF4890 domain-containing protein n=1 Tax=Flavobacterium sediminis TaxID=2201181 RepID=A0A2U8QW01_9FLAO|nr:MULTISPECIES: hypothetical protein [Flavobacterium]AWM14382.1 hypothetical protein DI487_11295 [Flavobacterium sediminis]MCO6175603.1 hypothetical protein [Flavobacterium sp. NRK F10]
MKKAVVLLAVFFVSFGAFAQEKTTEEKATEMTERMKEQIGFNEETEKKVQEINLDFVTKTEEIKEKDSGRMTKFKELKALGEERETQLKEVLTEEEFEAFKDHKTENRKEMKQRFKANRSK